MTSPIPVKLLSVRTHKSYLCPCLVIATLLTYSYTFLLKWCDLTVMTFIKPVKLVSSKATCCTNFVDAIIAEMEEKPLLLRRLSCQCLAYHFQERLLLKCSLLSKGNENHFLKFIWSQNDGITNPLTVASSEPPQRLSTVKIW